MDNIPEIQPIRERRYEKIPVDKIKVINSRDREQEQFEMNVESIEQIGLLKPIRVNDKFLERSGYYELICGEGRLSAHEKLGRTHVVAEVVTCTRKDAYLQSLVENIARTNPRSMDFAHELKRLRDEGLEPQTDRPHRLQIGELHPTVYLLGETGRRSADRWGGERGFSDRVRRVSRFRGGCGTAKHPDGCLR